MTAAHYKGGHSPGNDLGLHYTALPPIVASCPYSDQLLVTRKFWSPGANRPSQAKPRRGQTFDSWFEPRDLTGVRVSEIGTRAKLKEGQSQFGFAPVVQTSTCS